MRKRFNKYERKINREENLKRNLAGSGLYIFQNNTDGDLSLPKPTASGQRKVGPRGKFQGDSYFMAWVKPPLNLLKIVEVVITPEAERANMMEKKLILDQPDTVTVKGKVEQVCCGGNEECAQPLNDNTEEPKKKPDVLLTEDPMEGVEIILG